MLLLLSETGKLGCGGGVGSAVRIGRGKHLDLVFGGELRRHFRVEELVV
jgi:hypothetical protein